MLHFGQFRRICKTSTVLFTTSPLHQTFLIAKLTMASLTGNPNQHDISKFSEGMSGTCLCGSIQVTINDKELFTKPRGHLCHCSNCRKVAGSYVASNLLIEEEKVKLEDRKGTMKEFIDKDTGSGKGLSRFFCGTCGK